MGGAGMTVRRTGAAAGASSKIVVVGAAAEGRAGRNLKAILTRQLNKARDAARARAARRGRTQTAATLLARGVKPAAAPPPATASRNDIVGLVGEILAEDFLEDLGAGEPFYAKWRLSGTSASAGVDLVFKKDGFLSACESKHVHSSVRSARTAAAPVARELNRALEQNPDEHTENFLGTLFLGEEQHALQCAARSDEAGRKRSMGRRDVLENALGTGAYATNAVVVFDGAHSPAPAAVRSRIRLGAARRFRNPATGFLVGVRDLHGSTEAMIKAYVP